MSAPKIGISWPAGTSPSAHLGAQTRPVTVAQPWQSPLPEPLPLPLPFPPSPRFPGPHAITRTKLSKVIRMGAEDTMWVHVARKRIRSTGRKACLPCVLGYAGCADCKRHFAGVNMGIISFIKGGVHQLAIARPDSAKDYWVYKHPDQNIPNHAQLTVDSDEVALFFKDGKFVGSLSAGRHTLDGSSIPFLGQLVNKLTDGDVFICEVFFVTTRELPSIKFGTSIGDVQDPQTRLRIRLMVYGEFSARVIDPTKLVIGLVGQRATTNEGFIGWFKSQVQKVMKDGVAELIVKQNWPLMKVTSGAYTDEIEQATLQAVRKDIEPYGV